MATSSSAGSSPTNSPRTRSTSRNKQHGYMASTTAAAALIWAVLTSNAALSEDSASVVKKPDTVLNNPSGSTQTPPLESTTVSRKLDITNYLLPRIHKRCLKTDDRLNYIDHSLLIGTQQPDESLLDAFILCDGAFTWAAVSSNSDELNREFTWRLAFNINSPPECGDTLVLNSSEFSPLAHHQHWHSKMRSESVEFNCTNRVYPYLHKTKYRFAKLSWRRSNMTRASGMTISVLIYARFRVHLTREDRLSSCVKYMYNGFWCGSSSMNDTGGHCIYSNHYCNGYDDCLDAGSASDLSSDEIDCQRHFHGIDFLGPGQSSGLGPSAGVIALMLLAVLASQLLISRQIIV
uniref:Sortilin_C domain-containing protein n=3 Tax=Macrostomum lignano TaxID=282301 RepID=A0A1I8JJJ9_9PLAT